MVPPSGIKDRLYESFAGIGKAVSNPHRLELMDLLAQGEKPVDRLASQTGLSVANASAHLKVLHTARLVAWRRDGKHVVYRLAGEPVEAFWLALTRLGEGVMPEVRETLRDYYSEPDRILPQHRQALLERVARGEVVLLDVRGEDEYLAGHLPGAVSAPLEKLPRLIKTLHPAKDVVAYCRGPYCVMAAKAVELLRKKGFTAYRMEEGVMEWRADGQTLETGGVHS
ncbi:MAG: metalloregulator ArsR/SmtB family transcription factor [Deltaproteobacteria bacterium]|nr:metalloregulator ArsR/SmtB family transcription factor [Deltaproteobacteria bacterium]